MVSTLLLIRSMSTRMECLLLLITLSVDKVIRNVSSIGAVVMRTGIL